MYIIFYKAYVSKVWKLALMRKDSRENSDSVLLLKMTKKEVKRLEFLEDEADLDDDHVLETDGSQTKDNHTTCISDKIDRLKEVFDEKTCLDLLRNYYEILSKNIAPSLLKCLIQCSVTKNIFSDIYIGCCVCEINHRIYC